MGGETGQNPIQTPATTAQNDQTGTTQFSQKKNAKARAERNFELFPTVFSIILLDATISKRNTCGSLDIT